MPLDAPLPFVDQTAEVVLVFRPEHRLRPDLGVARPWASKVAATGTTKTSIPGMAQTQRQPFGSHQTGETRASWGAEHGAPAMPGVRNADEHTTAVGQDDHADDARRWTSTRRPRRRRSCRPMAGRGTALC